MKTTMKGKYKTDIYKDAHKKWVTKDKTPMTDMNIAANKKSIILWAIFCMIVIRITEAAEAKFCWSGT